MSLQVPFHSHFRFTTVHRQGRTRDKSGEQNMREVKKNVWPPKSSYGGGAKFEL